MKRIFFLLLLIVVGQFYDSDPKSPPVRSSRSFTPFAGSCSVMDTDNDGDLDLADYAVWQACFTGPDTSGLFSVFGEWDVFVRGLVDPPAWRGLYTFLPSGVVLIHDNNDLLFAAVYSFDGTIVEFDWVDWRNCNSITTAHTSLTTVGANEMSGTWDCGGLGTTLTTAYRRP